MAMEDQKYNPDRYIPAGKKLLEQYIAVGTPFDVSTRPYYSTGALKFEIAQTTGTSVFWVAQRQQVINLFSYAMGESMIGVNMGTRTATEGDTNMSVASETNNEDFCIEGLSLTHLGLAVEVDTPVVTNEIIRPFLIGQYPLGDIGSIVLPPEMSSPLALEAAVWECLKPNVSLMTRWDLKATDVLGVMSEVPEGGARSYLRASGEPRNDNQLRIPEGFIWRKTNADRDKLFNVQVSVQNPVGFITSAATSRFGNATVIKAVFQMRLHGTAFYYPSTN